MMPLSSILSHWAREISFRWGGSLQIARQRRALRLLAFSSHGGWTAESLAGSLRLLHRHFNIVPLAALVRRLQGSEEKTGHEIALIFGQEAHGLFQMARPVLRELKLPATVFLCPELVDNGQWTWPEEALARLAVVERINRLAFVSTVGSRASDPARFVDWMRAQSEKRRQFIIDKLREYTPDFTPSDEARAIHQPMTWDQLAAPGEEEITPGAGSLSYGNLAQLEPNELRADLEESRKRIEARLKRPCEFLLYPAGQMSDPVITAASRIYTAAITVDARLVARGESPHRLPAIPARAPLSHLVWSLRGK